VHYPGQENRVVTELNLFKYETDVLSFREGQEIFKEGEPGDVMYIIRQGMVQIWAGNMVLATLRDGDIFGEMALIDNKPRSATAVALSDCKVLPVDAERFTFLVQETPYFALEVLRIMAERLRAMNQRQRF
jgi:CRP/FNR family cyclic AMP-dependent transcriptional regulator